jgi:hypothetical protein
VHNRFIFPNFMLGEIESKSQSAARINGYGITQHMVRGNSSSNLACCGYMERLGVASQQLPQLFSIHSWKSIQVL